jgi:hypothetical protein
MQGPPHIDILEFQGNINIIPVQFVAWDLYSSPFIYSAADRFQVIEVGEVGRAFDAKKNLTKLYAHTQKSGGKWGDASQVRLSVKAGDPSYMVLLVI